MSNSNSDDDHLQDLPDGCGCVEVWMELSERRAEACDAPDETSETPERSPPA